MPRRDDHSRPRLSVCVAVYRDHGAPNLSTLIADLPDAVAGLSYETVVVLNGVPPDRAGAADGTRVIAYPENRGVPIAWNAAADAARGELLVVTNDDVRLGAGSLRMLSEAFERDPQLGVAGPVGTRWDVSVPRHIEYVDMTGLPPGTPVPCEVLSGFLLATPRETWLATGGFEEAFTPCGFEEVDYCTAVRLSLGQACCCIAGVPFEHEFGISAQRSWRRIKWEGGRERLGSIARRNRSYFQAKWSESEASDRSERGPDTR